MHVLKNLKSSKTNLLFLVILHAIHLLQKEKKNILIKKHYTLHSIKKIVLFAIGPHELWFLLEAKGIVCQMVLKTTDFTPKINMLKVKSAHFNPTSNFTSQLL